MTTVYETNRSLFRVSWGSVLAGSAIALVTYLVLSVLGTAIGASAVDPMAAGNPLSGFGTGAGSGCLSRRCWQSVPVHSWPGAPRRIAAACTAC